MDKGTQTEWSWLQDMEAITNIQDDVTSDAIKKSGDGIMLSLSDDGKKDVCENELLTLDEREEKDKKEEEINTQSLSDLVDELYLSSSSDCSDDEHSQTKDSNSSTLPHNSLPWPEILQYLRESDSQSSKYFGVSSNYPHPSIASRENVRNDECHFCGQQLQHASLLTANEDKEPEFCCSDYKDYCLLVAVYTKKMMDDKLSERPGKIPLKNHHVRFKKTAQERSLERLRRKRKWEENERNRIKMLESSSFLTMSRQTRVIQFSLSSTTCMNSGWTKETDGKRPTTNYSQLSKRSTKQRLSRSLLLPSIPDEVLNKLNTENEQEKTACVKLHQYNSGNMSVISLPDKSGQCYYPSGNIAMVILHIHPSIKSYLLYEDRFKGSLIGYLDELGRGWISNNERHSIRFLSTLNECYLFDGHDKVKHLMWGEVNIISSFLPLVFKINRYLSIKYNNHDDVMLCLVAEQQQHKFKIVRKAIDTHPPPIDKSITYFQVQLEKMTHRFYSHLSSLEKTFKLLRTGMLTLPQPPVSRKNRSTTVEFQFNT